MEHQHITSNHVCSLGKLSGITYGDRCSVRDESAERVINDAEELQDGSLLGAVEEESGEEIQDRAREVTLI